MPWVAQSVEAFASKLFALAYKNASITVASGNPADHLVHRHTHRVVRGCLLAIGRPDGRLNALTSAENTVSLSLNQASSIQNYGVTCESISIGHNPFKLPLSSGGIALPTHRPQFLCERELYLQRERERTTAAEVMAPTAPHSALPQKMAPPVGSAGNWLSHSWSRVLSWLCHRQSGPHQLGSGLRVSSSAIAHRPDEPIRAGSVPAMSASSLMGAMEGLCGLGDVGGSGAIQLCTPVVFDAVIKDVTVAKAVRSSARQATRKPGEAIPMFKRIEPIAEPFLGAWMATSSEFRRLTVRTLCQQSLALPASVHAHTGLQWQLLSL